MQPSISPDDREHANGEGSHGASEQPTQIMPPTAAVPSVAAASQQCAACGAALTPDQRYCVECGQRRGPLRMPATMSGFTTPQAPAGGEGERQRRGPRMSVNTTLIAGIGTLMLAMGVGVLIGRQATSSSGKPVQYVTVPSGTGTTGSGGTEAGGGSSTSESTNSSKSASAGSSKAKKTAAQILKGKNAPTKPVVKIGTPGKGPGYQKGHFTGKFFGGAETEKEEEEEEKAESTKTGKK